MLDNHWSTADKHLKGCYLTGFGPNMFVETLRMMYFWQLNHVRPVVLAGSLVAVYLHPIIHQRECYLDALPLHCPYINNLNACINENDDPGW